MNYINEYFFKSKKKYIEKIFDYYNFLYYRFNTYERFTNLSEEVFKSIYFYENINKEIKRNHKTKEIKNILVVLNGLDISQAPIKMHFILAKKLKEQNINYVLFSVLNKDEFNNFDLAEKCIKENELNYFIPKEYELEKRQIEYFKFLDENRFEAILFTSFYFSPLSIFILKMVENKNIILGRFVHQQPENFFDSKMDFIINWDTLRYFNKCNRIYDVIWPIDSDYINSIEEKICLRESYCLPKNSKLIMSIGRSIKFKNNNFWLFILNFLNKYQNYYFFVIGADYSIFYDLDKEITDKINQYKDRIIMLGHIENGFVLIKQCDIFLNTFPSGGGSALAEAYYFEKKILTFFNKMENPNPVENSLSIIENYFENAENIFPKYPDIDNLLCLADKLINDKDNFNEYYLKSKKYDIKNLEYKYFVENLIKFIKSIN
ncbi:hypothetical protein OF820_04345 [Oceanotoga sp. DSM 15011]|uniref:hypothetical protein n=1 Tax=Oceanotoga sp. DSM 15011 TaxID=2984951 RepID=UPI0021F3F2D4|nr:hypothetical protein [Oceanotoga sp. DSM 15011]UYP00918.1 hypothetical protein OF820_04345 [Oceanotoga sp. DSM 15011]